MLGSIESRGPGVYFALALMGVGACAHQHRYYPEVAPAYRDVCARVEVEPSTLLEKMVAHPLEFPYESWAKLHPKTPQGSLRVSEIKGVLAESERRIQHCYEHVLLAWPGARGTVTVRFGISPSGAVEGTAIVANETDVRELGCCIADVVRSWRFRPPDGGGPVLVTYPYSFKY